MVGAVTITSAVKSVPETVSVCSAEAVPEHAVKLGIWVVTQLPVGPFKENEDNVPVYPFPLISVNIVACETEVLSPPGVI